ncbi:sodium:solute symporter [Dietzia sp. DQ11-44]|uniref:Sodium:solute symporter n=2 Tax=Dietziaceae TaxID=85029 RepID=A0ABP4V4Y7_9ACTN|nr:sodium:solute symporter [Dietzia sp. Cai40]MBB1042928.1 sodium:solute symporter [Dietzia sp. DQ11-44]MBB1047297.1 sodium:solute symporter [Dietzia cercidiphylli]MBB1053945.1 sodium:solute symporter [Dietzia sp. B44]
MISVAIGATVVLLVILGLMSSTRVRGQNRNFAVAGRTLTVPLVAVLLMSQVVDSNATVGAADLAGGFGFWAGAALPLGLAASFLLMGLFVAEKVRERELYSLPEYFRQTFGRTGEILTAVLTVTSFGILMAGNLVALGHMMDHFIGVPYWAAIVFVTLAILAYTMVGGMFASVYTGLFLMGVMAVGFVGLTAWMFMGPGYAAPEGLGISDLEQLTAPAAGAAINWATFFALGFGNLVAIDLIQRVSSAKTARGARSASLIAAAGTVVLCVPLAAVAVAGAGLLGDSDSESPILFQLLTDQVPVPIAMLVIAALLAASLTTVSGILLATSSIVVGTVIDTRKLRLNVLQASRWSMVPVAVIGVIVALRVNHTGILLTLTFDLLCASIVAPFVLSLWTRLVSTRALVISAALGLGVRLGFFVLTPTIYGVENTLLYIPNEVVTTSVDGWTTFLAAAVSLVVYVAVAAADTRADTRKATPAPAVDESVPDRGVEVPARA